MKSPSSSTSWRRQSLSILLILLELPIGALGFVPLSRRHQSLPFTTWNYELEHTLSSALYGKINAKKSRSGGATSKSKTGRPPKNKRKSGASTQQKDQWPKKDSTGAKKNTSANSKPTPPWQVMSTKEAKINIEKEKQRREKARQGIHESPSLDVSEPKVVLSISFLNEADQRFLKWKRFNPVSAPSGMRFVGSYLDRRLPPSLGVPEIAFLGRSNVGKSSLLNRLFSTATSTDGSSDHARVGKTPGATASVNLYALTSPASKQQRQQQSKRRGAPSATKDILGFVDLPGFGYAKLSKDIQESVQEAAENFLSKRRELALGILLVDIRRAPPSDDDRAVLAALYDMGLPLLVVATKVDKIKNPDHRQKNLEEIRIGLGLPEGQPLAVSSVTGDGTKMLWNIILETCETAVNDFRKTYEEGVLDEEEDDDAGMLEGTGDFEAEADEVYYDDDDDGVAYNMGYDWIHGGDYGDYADDGLLDFDGEDDDGTWASGDANDDEFSANEENPMNAPRTGETMRSLKQRAREMERRGEV